MVLLPGVHLLWMTPGSSTSRPHGSDISHNSQSRARQQQQQQRRYPQSQQLKNDHLIRTLHKKKTDKQAKTKARTGHPSPEFLPKN